jgi:hypothetical protein
MRREVVAVAAAGTADGVFGVSSRVSYCDGWARVDERRIDMRIGGTLSAVMSAALIAGVVACGGSSNTSTSSSSSRTATSSTSSGASASPSSSQPAAAPLLNITIANGQVTPTNAVVKAKVGQPITVQVTSDAPDELHVHSTPDHEFEIAAAPNQTFQFSIDLPGSVDVELHKLDKTVATIQVSP